MTTSWSLLGPALASAASTLLMGRLVRAGEAVVPRGADGSVTLVYAPAVRYLALAVAVGAPLFCVILAIAHPPVLPGEWLALILAVGGFFLLGSLLLLEVGATWVAMSLRGVQAHAFRGAPRFLAWSDIVRVRYLPLGVGFVLEDRWGQRVRVSPLMIGRSELVEQMRRRLPEHVVGRAVQKWRR